MQKRDRVALDFAKRPAAMLTQAQTDFARSHARAVIARGAAGSGKTVALAARAMALLEQGIDADDILFVVPNRTEQAAARDSLALMGAASVLVKTMAELDLQILATPQAREATGRTPRLISQVGRAVIDEDLKTLAIPVKRLREMIKFLERGVTELREDDPDFIIMAEERMVMTTLHAQLREMGAIAPFEASPLAFGFLNAHPEQRAAFMRAHVLADGYTQLNMASQRLLASLARESLAVAGDPSEPGVDAEPYPHAQGLDELATAWDAQSYELGEQAWAKTREVQQAAFGFPEDEIEAIAKWIDDRIQEGMPAREIAVVAPNRAWGRKVCMALEARGLATSALLGAHALAGDPRKLDRSVAQQAYALLALAANERDPLAWRLWTGFGDALLRSAAWRNLRAYATEQGADLQDALLALSHVAGEPFAGADALRARVELARAALDRLDGLAGNELLDAIESQIALMDEGCPARAFDDFHRLFGADFSDEGAQELFARAHAQLLDSVLACQDGLIRVGRAKAFAGSHAQVAVLGGLVDVFVPDHACFNERLDQQALARNLERQRQAFACELSLGTMSLALTRFTRAWLFDAEPAGMEVERISADPKGRLATIRPSTFLVERGDELPPARDRLL